MTSSEKKTTTIVLIRHGECEGKSRGVVPGTHGLSPERLGIAPGQGLGGGTPKFRYRTHLFKSSFQGPHHCGNAR